MSNNILANTEKILNNTDMPTNVRYAAARIAVSASKLSRKEKRALLMQLGTLLHGKQALTPESRKVIWKFPDGTVANFSEKHNVQAN